VSSWLQTIFNECKDGYNENKSIEDASKKAEIIVYIQIQVMMCDLFLQVEEIKDIMVTNLELALGKPSFFLSHAPYFPTHVESAG
jgi:hypothetical protein